MTDIYKNEPVINKSNEHVPVSCRGLRVNTARRPGGRSGFSAGLNQSRAGFNHFGPLINADEETEVKREDECGQQRGLRGQRSRPVYEQPGMNLPGHVEPCQSEAQLAIHHTALAACHCRHGVFLLCVCERDGCSPAVRAPHQRHVHLHPRGPPVKTERRPFALPRSDSSPWMDGRNGDRE
ncbi:hypothetical protein Q8A73_009383 [Channa argus]|nr:hypothetical protein Q8A73_009383 [Channa argus]